MLLLVLAFAAGACDTLPLPTPRPQAVAAALSADALDVTATPETPAPPSGGGTIERPGPLLNLPVYRLMSRSLVRQAADTDSTPPRRRRVKAIEYSDWYATRLQIHKAASWATLPLFVGQYFTGEALIAQGTSAPDWVKRAHPILATGVLALFATNTVTGGWNLWEGREDPKGRVWRMAHSILMLASDGGFAYVGALTHSVKQSAAARNQHRSAALASAGVALVSYVMMLPPFRRE